MPMLSMCCARAAAAALSSAALLPSCASAALPTPPPSAQPAAATPGRTFGLRTFATGFSGALWVGHAPGDPQGVWVAQQNGQVFRVRGGKRQLKVSIAARTTAAGEQGLLGVAFLPSFATTKLVVLSSTNHHGDSRVELWRLGRSPARAKLVRTLLRQPQPYANHNGGHVTFGAGDTLYVGFGDGGSGNDPQRNAQNAATKLGKILAATVTPTGRSAWRTVAYGLRNPWRFSFDPELNELWVGDVGQDAIEEVDRIPLTGAAPNLGWSVFEGGRRDTAGDDHLAGSGPLLWPVITYAHGDDGCSITGGAVYRGSAIAALRGRYVYGDFCSGRLWTAAPDGDGAGPVRREAHTVPQLTSFGTDAAGELYAVSGGGTISALVP
jgi:glucose/arabinose dehydrogenase